MLFRSGHGKVNFRSAVTLGHLISQRRGIITVQQRDSACRSNAFREVNTYQILMLTHKSGRNLKKNNCDLIRLPSRGNLEKQSQLVSKMSHRKNRKCELTLFTFNVRVD